MRFRQQSVTSTYGTFFDMKPAPRQRIRPNRYGIRSVVEALLARAVSTVANHLRWQRQAEEQTGERQGEEQRPLELWRDMASFVAGPREDAISTAFSQEAPPPSSQPGATASPPTPAQGTSATPPAQPAQASGVAADTVDGAGGVRWRSQRSKFTVDFQKIYLYLAGVGRHQRDCILTPMGATAAFTRFF
ncbi:hypothetical protein CRUP_037632 [Coryphaenoides rupestris]|nr:hypothetical protein CRUP_037632 [Coryphaenoides rupestris]